MRKPLILLSLLAFVLSAVKAQTDYTQFLVVNLKPRPDRISQFEAGLGAHNKKYHTADPFKAYVWSVQTGPASGSYYYVLGPTTFTQWDARTTTPEHDADWNNSVLAHCESVGEANYWRWDKDINYSPEGGSANFGKSRLRYVTINPGEGDRYEDQLKKIVEVYKQKKYPATYNVYWRFGASAGPHACVEINFANWAFFDTPSTFMQDFESIHGEGSYQRFLDEFSIAIDRTKTYDELMNFVPELSSN